MPERSPTLRRAPRTAAGRALAVLVAAWVLGGSVVARAQEPAGEHLPRRARPPAAGVRPSGLAAYDASLGAPAASEADRQFDRLVDEFLLAYLRAQPVRATMLGLHDYDALFPATDSAGIGAWQGQLEGFRARLAAIDPARLGAKRRIDHAVLARTIERELGDLRSGGAWRRDPGVYVAMISDGIHALVERDFAPLTDRTWNVVARLWAVPDLLRDARRNLADPSPAAAALALEPSAELVRFLANQLPGRVAPLHDNDLREEFEHHLASASGSAAEYHHWLETAVVAHRSGAESDSPAAAARAPTVSALDSLLALHPEPAAAAGCGVAAASPWIGRWLAAWELTSRDILHLPDAPAPNIVFYDTACVYTTSSVAAGGAEPVAGPALLGASLPWRALAHGDSLTLPNGSRVPVQLMSFTSVDRKTGPFFVMAAPSYWSRMGHGAPNDSGPTGVFLHEFAHTRQLPGIHTIGPIDSTWKYEEELDDDAVQKHFGSDSVYVSAYLAERDLLYRAAAAGTSGEARALAREALAMIKRRHARWFVGDKAEFAILDDTFLSLEGAGQFAGVAWLSHPNGGGMTREAAVAKMLGRRRWWVQDEGLALFLVVDRLLPGWPLLVFGDPSMGATELLARAALRPG